MEVAVSKDTMYSKTDDDDLQLILGIGIFGFFLNLFLLAIFIAVAIRQGHWQFVVADLVGSYLVIGVVKLRKWNESKHQRHMRQVIPQFLLDTVIWISMAVVTGFSWTLITYTMYLMVNWPMAIFFLPAYYETKIREKLKKDNETQT